MDLGLPKVFEYINDFIELHFLFLLCHTAIFIFVFCVSVKFQFGIYIRIVTKMLSKKILQ